VGHEAHTWKKFIQVFQGETKRKETTWKAQGRIISKWTLKKQHGNRLTLCLSPQRPRVTYRSVHILFVMIKVAMGHVFLLVCWFSCSYDSISAAYSFIHHQNYVT
jgi:hypothetical protein